MTGYRIIGDTHGKWDRYKKIISGATKSIQIGDCGVGFARWDWHEGVRVPLANPPYDLMVKHNARFIRGNHDNPEVCKRHTQWIPDGTIELADNHKIMFVGGALSVDKEWRTEGLDWWADEELSYTELQDMIDIYEREKPDVLISHDCPESIAIGMEQHTGRRKLDINSRTRNALQTMIQIHPPKWSIFGHWHSSFDYIDGNGTHFKCLNELEAYDIDL